MCHATTYYLRAAILEYSTYANAAFGRIEGKHRLRPAAFVDVGCSPGHQIDHKSGRSSFNWIK